VLIAGGKLTTYRVMARDAVDMAARTLRRYSGEVGPSITDRVPLLGAQGFETRTNQRVALARAAGLDITWIDHLLHRYGGLIDEVLPLMEERPELAEPLIHAEDYLGAEVVYAVTHEGARHLDDVLTRRTRISIETFDRGVLCAPQVAELMASVLGWDADRVAEEVDHYLRRVEAERQSQRMTTDQEADEARVQAPEGPWAV
jgi:glycerol-3-phosphate dehydrogenase